LKEFFPTSEILNSYKLLTYYLAMKETQLGGKEGGPALAPPPQKKFNMKLITGES
jgi:hypothetical protein